MSIQIKQLGCCDYWNVWQKMQEFTATRNSDTPDEIWLVEHPPVFTQGQAGKPEHILNPGSIPVVQTDRGGQVTYHGPGQCVAYPLIDLRRLHFSIRQLVSALETAVIHLLADYNIPATTLCQAPGVYVFDQKICSIGLRVKRGCSYHGLALNVAMDLTPFLGINPCGMQQLQMTQIRNFVPDITLAEVQSRIAIHLHQQLRPHEVPA